MPFEVRFYGDDPATTLREVRALLNIGERVESTIKETPDAESGSQSIQPVQPVAPVAPVAPRRGRTGAAKKDAGQEGQQVDLEEAISDIKSAEEREFAEPPPKDVSKDQLRTKLIELMNVKGEDAPTTLLSEKFNVAKIGELDPKQYAACFAAADDALGESDDE